MNNLISIIVPVYNTEKFLPACIQSVINQQYKYWELLLIDDGSTDNSLIICNSFANNDNRITAFHKTNSGVSDTRNFGINQAQGDWLTFLDSDDELTDIFLEQAMAIAEKGNYDIVAGSCELIYKNKSVKSQHIVDREFNTQTKVELIKSLLTDKNHYNVNALLTGFPYLKIFKKKIIALFPPDIHYKEDVLFNLHTIAKANNIVLTPNIWYKYNIYSGTASSKFYPNYIDEIRQYMKYCAEYTNIVNWNLHTEIGITALRMYMTWLKLCVFHKDNKSSIIKKMTELKKSFIDVFWQSFFRDINFKILPQEYRVLLKLYRYKSAFGIYLLFKLYRLKKYVKTN